MSKDSLPAGTSDHPSIYIHIPYCRTKCQYCSFLSYPRKDGQPDYLQALIHRIHDLADHPWIKPQSFASIFIGGGTPTIYSGSSLALLLNSCFDNFNFIDQPEITIESNPNSISKDQLSTILAVGVNRLSIGVQSFDDRLLHTLGRSHSVQDAVKAISTARRAGFKNINLDLMYGLPDQTIKKWNETIKTAVSLAPEHLALYELSIDEGTPFAGLYNRGMLNLPDDDMIIKMEEFTYPFLSQNGYIRYEISNFGKPGFFCRHNINYWRNGSYLGLGAGAVSCFSGLRLTNTSDPQVYIDRAEMGYDTFADGEALSNEASFRESVIMGLRILTGISLNYLQKRYGIDPVEYYGSTLQRFVDRGMICLDSGQIKLTAKALPIANQVLSELV